MTVAESGSSSPGHARASAIVGAWPLVLPALVVFLLYLPAVRFDFVWDDTIFLRDVPNYRDPALWLPSLFRPFVLSPNYFRPLALLTFAGELRLVGLNPALFHLTNVLLHTLNTGLVALLALRLGGGRRPLAVAGAAALYGLHPTLVEAAAFVSGRFDLLMTTFLLLALLADVTVRHRLARPVLVGVAFLLAALSKEMAVALVLALPFWHLARRATEGPDFSRSHSERGNGLLALWQQRWTYLAVVVAGLGYLGLRYLSLGYLLLSTPERVLPAGGPIQHILLLAKSLAGYVLLIVWPFGTLSPIHFSDLPVPLTDLAAWAGLAALGLLAAGLVWLVRRAPRAGWLAIGGVLALLPVVNVLPLELGGGAFIAERFLLFPLALLALAASQWVQPAVAAQSAPSRDSRLTTGALGLWMLAAIVTLQLTLPHWRDDMSLWNWAAGRAPRSSTPPANLALQHIGRGAYELGLDLAWQAIELNPTNSSGWNNAGLALIYMERPGEAQAAFEQALALQPESALYWNNLAGALREQGELGEAEQVLLDQALRLDPYLPAAHLNLGIVYLRADRPDRAAIHLQEAVRLLPPGEQAVALDLLAQSQEPERWLLMGDLMLGYGEAEGALWAFEQADVLGGSPADVGAGLSSALIALGDWQGAQRVLDRALELAPNDARIYNNLGLVAREMGEFSRARQLFERAVQLAPEWDVPLMNLEMTPTEDAGGAGQP